jgi:hypothetical protein
LFVDESEEAADLQRIRSADVTLIGSTVTRFVAASFEASKYTERLSADQYG